MTIKIRQWTATSSIQILCLMAILCASLASAVPIIILSKPEPYCVNVDVSERMTLFIDYESPDYFDPQRGQNHQRHRRSSNKNNDGNAESNNDIQNNIAEKVWGKINLARGEGYYDIDAMRNNIDKLSQQDNEGSRKVRHYVRSKTGSLEFKTGYFTGLISICSQSFVVSDERPARMIFHITQRPTLYAYFYTTTVVNSTNMTVPDPAVRSPITNELRNMERRLQELTHNADSNRDRTVQYHKLTLLLYKAVRYWPIFKVVVLIIAGYMQVYYIVAYMRTIWMLE